MSFIDEKRKTVKKREGKMREKRRDITVKKRENGEARKRQGEGFRYITIFLSVLMTHEVFSYNMLIIIFFFLQLRQ